MNRRFTHRYRKGAVGALLDEFDRAAGELQRVIGELTDEEFEAVLNPGAEDPDFRSIQGVINHVVRAGHAHANHLRVAFSMPWTRVEVPLGTRDESLEQLASMVAYVEATLDGRWEMTDAEIEAVVIESGWGVTYDLEQMLEHAIVHVLRHRRQIERFLAGSRESRS